MSRRPRGLYALVDESVHGLEALPAVCARAEQCGATWIQLRCKDLADRTFHDAIVRVVEAMKSPRQHLWINDRVDLAAAFPVRGVHLGQEDLPPSLARPLLAANQLIGLSCHDRSQIEQADADNAVDVVAIGPLFETRSKQDPEPVVGIDGLRAARETTTKPLVAIGGIDQKRYLAVRREGADLVAMIGALGRGERFGQVCSEVVAQEEAEFLTSPTTD